MQTKKHKKTQSKRNHKKVIGKLYATWCGHCQTLEPEWDKMKTSITKYYKNGGIEFVEIESENMEQGLADLNKRLNTDIALQGGYPTLFKVEPDTKKVEYYGGQREAVKLTNWYKGTSGSLMIPPSGRTKIGGKRKTKSKRTLKH